jgi:hypothetical protein
LTGLADHWVQRLLDQVDHGVRTYVFLTSSVGGTWRTELLDVATDEADVESDLVPSYYEPDTYHSLWGKLAKLGEVSEEHILAHYVKAADGEPVGLGALHNQTPVILTDKPPVPIDTDDGTTPFAVGTIQSRAAEKNVQLPEGVYQQVWAGVRQASHLHWPTWHCKNDACDVRR